MARDVEELIEEDGNHRRQEHFSLLYVGLDGRVHHTTILEGSGGQVSLDLISQAVLEITSQGIPASNIIGFEHNHDRAHYGVDGAEAQNNQYVSNNDWNTADYLVETYNLDPDTFRMYLVDTNDFLREFDYNDEDFFRGLTQEDKLEGEGLPPVITADRPECGG